MSSATNPRGVEATACALRSRSPAATTRTTDTAICTAASARWRPPRPVARGPGVPGSVGGRTAVSSRNPRQTTIQVEPATASIQSTTPASGRAAVPSGASCGSADRIGPTHRSIASAASPPAPASTRQLGGERTYQVQPRRPQCTPHRQLVRLFGAARQQQQGHGAAGREEEDARDHQQDGQKPGRFPVILRSEPDVIDGSGDETPVPGPAQPPRRPAADSWRAPPAPPRRYGTSACGAGRRWTASARRDGAASRRCRARAARKPTTAPRSPGRGPGRAAGSGRRRPTVNGCEPSRTVRPTMPGS